MYASTTHNARRWKLTPSRRTPTVLTITHDDTVAQSVIIIATMRHVGKIPDCWTVVNRHRSPADVACYGSLRLLRHRYAVFSNFSRAWTHNLNCARIQIISSEILKKMDPASETAALAATLPPRLSQEFCSFIIVLQSVPREVCALLSRKCASFTSGGSSSESASVLAEKSQSLVPLHHVCDSHPEGNTFRPRLSETRLR